jgi:putative flippase GtrA
VNVIVTSSRLRFARAFLRNVRSPQWGLAGQGFRFALAGSLVAGVYVGVTTVLHDVFDVRFQLALVVGFSVGVAVHFTLQRVFVWRHHAGFALPIHHQAIRYLGIGLAQYGLTALSTSQLPSMLSLPVEVVYVATVCVLAGLNFVLFRGRVFHADASGEHTMHPPVSIATLPAPDRCG